DRSRDGYEGGARDPCEHVLRRPQPVARPRRRHRHEREDHDRVARPPPAHGARRPDRPHRHGREPGRRPDGGDGLHHPRGHRTQPAPPCHGGRRLPRLRDGGIEPRARPRPRPRPALPRRRLHQPDARPPRLPPDARGLRCCQEAALRRARRRGRRRRQPRRPGLDVDGSRHRGRRRHLRHGPDVRRPRRGARRRARRAPPPPRRRRAEGAAGRAVQRAQPRGGVRRGPCARLRPGRGARRARRRPRRPRPLRDVRLRRRRARRRGLRPHARRARKRPRHRPPDDGRRWGPALGRLRLRGRPRPHEAPRDGRGRRAARRPRRPHQRQPAHGGPAGHPRRDPGRAGAPRGRHDPPGPRRGHRPRRRRGGRGRRDRPRREGPRALPGRRHREARLRRPPAPPAGPRPPHRLTHRPMLYFLVQWLERTFEPPGFQVFAFTTVRAGLAAGTALLIGLFAGKKIIAALARRQIGETVREGEDAGAVSHAHKAGTPTMGGVILLLALLGATLLWGDLTNFYVWVAVIATAWMGLVGFADDYIKVVRKNKQGLAEKTKLVGQISLGVLMSVLLLLYPGLHGQHTFTSLPFVPDGTIDYDFLTPLVGFELGWLVYIPVLTFILAGVSNAVNLTDGLDG